MEKIDPKKLWGGVLPAVLGGLALLSTGIFCYSFHYSLLIVPVLFFSAMYLSLEEKCDFKLLAQMGLLVFLVTIAAHVIKQFYSTAYYFYLPVAGVAMLTMLLFNNLRLAFVLAIVCSLTVSLVLQGDFTMMLTFLLGSIAAVIYLRDTRTRGQVITAGIFVSALSVLCLVLTNWEFHNYLSRGFLSERLYPLMANGFICSIVVMGTLKIFESLFGALTNFSLLELSDFNHPLLKRMILEAPGTYHHSLVVSNLAEAAANAIGANALLTRVGAYYHDIGKMVKPEYFTENQLMGHNKHDEIEPSMSRLVILNHIKEGVELAQKYKLNQAIVDFIPQHHGTGLIHYFYQKSLEEAQEGEVINEENYRYAGPKPQTRETAITMLADSVEGSTRALNDPNANNIADTVKKIINNRFIDGQLDECNLTLTDIDKISSTFIRILTAMYHTRIKYPEKKNGHSNRKPSEKNSNPSSGNPATGQGDPAA